MTLRVYTGLPATGKTSTMISEMKQRSESGGNVVLFLSSEHEELTRRPNVKPGGLMGSRVPGAKYEIDHVVDTGQAASILETLTPGTLAVFDEAQYFRPEITRAWEKAVDKHIDIYVGTPSQAQLDALTGTDHERVHLEVDCSCGLRKATKVIYDDDLTYPTHLCDQCFEERMTTDMDQLLADVKEAKPFPGELHTYQPFFEVPMDGWELVRGDSPQRLDIIRQAVLRCAAVKSLLDEPVAQPTFVDLGCCSGFFSDGMTHMGFKSSGVDVDEDFIDWGTRLARIKGQSINYQKSDLFKFLTESEDSYDVISTFATVQWVMDQHGYEAGITCFKRMFEKAKHICVVEMGYTTEEIYQDKIKDKPEEIDRDWVLKMLSELGDFAAVEVHPSGENGIWRDIFVGFKEDPTPEPLQESISADAAVQISNTSGLWSDDWVAASFEVYLKATADCSNLSLEGWRPDDSGECEITVSVAGSSLPSVQVNGGVFEISHEVNLPENRLFRLAVSCSNSIDAPDDDRDLAFVLRRLSIS